MASQLRVDEIIASTGSSVAIGTAGGSVTLAGDFTVDTSKGLNVGTGASIFSPSSNTLTLGTNNAERVRIDSSGRIGFGTNAPQTALHLFGSTPIIRLQDSDSTGTATLQRIEGTQTGSTQWFVGQNSTSDNELWIQNVSNDDIRFGTNNTERLRITNTGNVGIGTNNPVVRLHVVSSGTEQVRLSKNGAEGLEVFLGNNTDSNLFQHFNRTSNTWVENRQNALRHTFANSGNGNEVFRIESNGNVGINSTSPAYLLDIASGNASMRLNSTSTSTLVITSGASNAARIEFGDTANNDTGYIYYDNSDDSMRFATNGSNERLRILSSGGITFNGDTAATNALDDYEEGNVTMTATVSSGTLTVTGQSVRYTKIGRLVTVTGFFQTYSSSASGNVTFGGLPYAAVNVTNGGGGGTCQVWKYNGGNPTEIYPCNIHVIQNSTTFEMYFKNSSGNAEKIEAADMNGSGNIGQVYSFNLSYITS